MQIRASVIAAAVLLSTGAVAASTPVVASGNSALANRDFAGAVSNSGNNAPAFDRRATRPTPLDAKLVSVMRQMTAGLSQDLKSLKSYKGQHSSKTMTFSDAKPVVVSLTQHISSSAQALSKLSGQHAAATRDLLAREGILETIVGDLIDGLNAIDTELTDFLKQVLDTLGLGAVSDLIDSLTPALDSLKTALEQLLTNAGNALGNILDPVLNVVTKLLDSLLGGGSSSKRSVPAAAQLKMVQLTRARFAANKAETARLLSQKKAVNPADAKRLVSSVAQNARLASGVLRAVHASAGGSSGLAARQLTDADLSAAIAGLVADLNTLLPGVKTLLGNLLTNLGLDGVKALVDELEPALDSLVGSVEKVLLALGNALSPVVDPLLDVLAKLVGGLGAGLANLLG